MAHVGIVNNGAQRVLVGAGYHHSVFLNIFVEYSEIYLFYDVKALVAPAILIGANDAHVVTLGFERPYQVHGCNGRAVVFLAENITDYCNFHCSVHPLPLCESSPDFLFSVCGGKRAHNR